MAVVQPANPRDVQDFQFKLHSRLKVFTAQNGMFASAVNLVATASKYGLIFVGCPTGIQVITSSSIIGLEHPSGGTGGEVINYPRREIPLPSQPSHLNVNCDQNYLVVAIKRNGCAHALIYSVPSFTAKDIVLVTEVRLSSKSDTSVLELAWNPGILNILAACLSDGSMAAYELKRSGVDISTLPPATQANCFCWSPKGKQLVVGSEGGTLTQYKPDLKEVKTFSPPNLGSGSVAVINVLWLSNYQFAAIYKDKVNTDERPGLLIVNAPKTGPLSFVNYEDICYSGGDLRAPQYYLIHQSSWNILMMASANSMEVGVLGLQEDQISWEQWTQEDAARAELPLSVDKQETFPVGFGLDTSTQHELPWGENQSIAPMPVLCILSHQGVLCLFYAINLRPNAACLCSPPEKLPDESGLAMFTTVPTEAQSHVNSMSQEIRVTADPQHTAVDGVGRAVDQSLEFSTSLRNGAVLTSLDGGVGNVQVPLTQKFEIASMSQASSSFGFGTTLSSVSSSGSQAGLANAPSTSFGTNPAGALSASFGTGVAVTSSSGFGLTGTSFAGFGAPSAVFGTSISSPSTTSLSHTSTSSFGTGVLNPVSTAFGMSHGTLPSVTFGTGPVAQLSIGTSSSANPPNIGFGAGLKLSASVPAAKPMFSFLSSTTTAATAATVTTTKATITTTTAAAVASLKPAAVQATTGFTFTAPTATAAAATSNFKLPPLQTATNFMFTPTTAATAAAASSLKPAPVQSVTNFTFTAPSLTSTPIAQQASKQTTSTVIPQLQSRPVKLQASLIGSTSESSVQNPEQMFGTSVTVTKVPAAAVPSTQSVRIEAPTSDVKLPTHNQMKQATSMTPAAAAKPTVNNSVFYNAINEEIVHFDSEMAALRSRVNGINVEVGSEDEKRGLCLKTDAMDEFWRELKDTTQFQSSEIHGLKSVLIEAFAWVEEAKSRTQQLNCPMYIQLAQSQALDPVSARYTANIKHLVYYVENQLRQLNELLDSRWLEFQDSCKPSVKNKMHIPSLESVYQAMVMQNNVLNRQRAIMADIARRAQEQGRSTQIPLISSAVLARVREKEDAQLKEETELSQLAENLVKMKLGPYDVLTSNGTGLRYHCLSRKKESLLRGVLSQRTVTRVCSTKPFRTTMGGISTGKPIVNKNDTVVGTVTPTSVAATRRVPSTVSGGVATTEPKYSPIISVTKSDSPQSPLFLFGLARSSREVDAVSKTISKGLSSVDIRSASPNKETLPGKSVAISSGIFSPRVESSIAKPNILDSTSTLSISGSHASDLKNKGATVGELSFAGGLHSEKPSAPGNFSFGLGPNNASSFAKPNDVSKRLEDHYEDISPPGTPEYSHGEAISSTGNSVSSSSFTFNFTVTPTTTKAGIMPSSSNRRIISPLLTTPIMSLNSIVAGIGDSDSAAKPTTKPVVDNKPIEMSSTNNATSGAAFSFGSLSLGQPQHVGSRLGKADEPIKSSETFTFSLAGSLSSSVPTPSSPVSSRGDTSQATPKTPAATTTGVNSKTPILTGLGTQNHESNSSPQVNIFGAVESQKPSPSFVSSENTSVSSSSASIFAQPVTSVFGNLTTGSPAKQPVSLGHMFGATPNSAGTMGKESTDSTVSSTEHELQKPELTPESQSVAISSSENENLFSQSSFLLGSLSIGSGASSKAGLSGNMFGGGSDPLASNFIFGKQSASTESQNSIGVQNAPEATVAAESPETQIQESESPSKNTQTSASKPIITPSFDQTHASPDENSKSAEGTETHVVPSTSSAFGSAKTESTTAFTFSQSASSPSAPETSVVFGQTKPLTGSIFGTVVTPPATSQQTVAPLTSAATTTAQAAQTSLSANTTFSFSLPTSAPSSTPFGQKATNMFGQPVSSDAPATTSSGSFFGQPVCSPTAFGQSGGSVFGQPAATTAAKTNIFGQNTATTTTPSVFGQGNASTKPNIFGQTSTSFFGQAPATGSSFLSGGFASKPTFGQSGGSIFGQSSSSGFGGSGTSVFGGGSNVFGGSSSPSGSPFQPSTGGNIFGGSTSSVGSTTGGGAFSSGLGQSIIQSGFGTPAAFQSKPGGFGGSPVFDRGASGFGASPTFGGAPTFGGSPTFGSPGKVFGSSSPTSSVAFVSPGQQSSTFESLASQNTMTFGNLAQNQSQGFGSPTQSIFGGNQTQQQTSAPAFSSGSNTFGGSSFSSWR